MVNRAALFSARNFHFAVLIKTRMVIPGRLVFSRRAGKDSFGDHQCVFVEFTGVAMIPCNLPTMSPSFVTVAALAQSIDVYLRFAFCALF